MKANIVRMNKEKSYLYISCFVAAVAPTITTVHAQTAKDKLYGLTFNGYMGKGNIAQTAGKSKTYDVTIILPKDNKLTSYGSWKISLNYGKTVLGEGKTTFSLDPKTNTLTITLKTGGLIPSTLLTFVKPGMRLENLELGYLFVKKGEGPRLLTEVEAYLPTLGDKGYAKEAFDRIRFQLQQKQSLGYFDKVNSSYFNKTIEGEPDFAFLTATQTFKTYQKK